LRYFVIAPDGSKFGPADPLTLRQWMAEGRVAPDTWLEEEGTGRRVQARNVLGFEAPAQLPPSGHHQPRAEFASRADSGSADFWLSIVCSVLGILCCGLFIIGGFTYARRAMAKGNPGGKFAIGWAIFFLLLWILSSILTVMLWPQLMDFIRSRVGVEI
jgi:hypothetical protein